MKHYLLCVEEFLICYGNVQLATSNRSSALCKAPGRDNLYGDSTVSNIFEKFKVHCVNDVAEVDIEKYEIQDTIIFKSVGKCSVWGEYNSNLSVEAIVEIVK